MSDRLVWALSTCCLFAAGSAAAVAADFDAASQRELKAMAGVWTPVATEVDGFKVPERWLTGTRVTRETSGRVVSRQGDKVALETTITAIGPAASPKTIDSVVTAGEHKGAVLLGIYELNGDTLRICLTLPGKGDRRPADFSAPSGSGRSMIVYKRSKS